jgi:2-dehydro-3-deoxygalactonokinase
MTEPPAALIGIDWGTSSFRAYRIDGTGRVLAARAAAAGILSVADGDFASVLQREAGDWLADGLPVLLSGMIGSRQGWLEVPYCALPAGLPELAGSLIRHPDQPRLHFLPGLARLPADAAPDVLRGEEAQLLGALGEASGRQLAVLPGTHSKWALVEDGRIAWFQSFMTGELFAVLRQHSILGRLMAGDTHDAGAFQAGLDYARRGPGGLLGRLFSARTLGLFERLPATGLASYLSGLLIGTELAEALGGDVPEDDRAVLLIGTSALVERYAEALSAFGWPSRRSPPDIAAKGHYLIARTAGLLP